MKEPTPLMKQYYEIKGNYPDSILFFRLGDFYEMFGDDARKASRILHITLTTRDKSSENPLPMCGIPYFSSETYIKKLIIEGLKVAICEQVEDPSEARGIVKREVVRVITPGTYESENPKENTYILSFTSEGSIHGIALADVSTGDFIVYESDKPISDEINRFDPKEVLCPESLRTSIYYSEILKYTFTSFYEDYHFDIQEAYKRLLAFFKVSSLDGFGCEGLNTAISAAGALITYLQETQKGLLSFHRLRVFNTVSCMFLDGVTKKNLELLTNLKDNTREETLLQVMDETLTPMGGRFLTDAMLKPLIERDEIVKRHDSVETFFQDYRVREALRALLKDIQDVERLTSRLVKGTVDARDLMALKASVIEASEIKTLLKTSRNDYLNTLSDAISECGEMVTLIEKCITESPPPGVKDGGIIRAGFHPEIDELREISTKGKGFLTELEKKERERTGIQSLKVGYNRVFGYFIEITKTNLPMTPDHYVRKQTLANAERFITEELKDYENKILGAEERLKNIEYHVFREIVERVMVNGEELQRIASSIALLDFLQALSTVARKYNYTKPVIHSDGKIEITGGRHPVLERLAVSERFIPNDASMDMEENRLLIITGPNMAGKSTFMRQTALIVLMTQMGSFVPVESAHMGIVDRIFTRIGASDYLARGQSTFMVEMIETANVLHNATEKSLILLDEVGRGTSTFDGISIAWAVAEQLINRIKAKTLFATHYNELTELALTLNQAKNYNVSVKEWGDEIIFLRKITKGPADKSYGIQVARLAGLPEEVIVRAREILANLEKEELSDTGEPRFALKKRGKASEQLDLFAGMTNPAMAKLSQLDLEGLQPGEALDVLRELKRLCNG